MGEELLGASPFTLTKKIVFMKYFSISELTRSQTAAKHGILNRCDSDQKKNLEALVKNVLDPAREEYCKPILVSSGFRCEEVNTLVGGAHNSQHLKGEAADIYTNEGPEGNLKVANIIIARGQFDQLIFEGVRSDGLPRWIHVSWKRNGHNRKQVFSYR